MSTAGGFLVYAGVRNVPLLDGLREMSQGRQPTPGAVKTTPVSWSSPSGGGEFETGDFGGPNTALVRAAMKYIGVPYKWGGTNPAVGLDCSGLVRQAFADIGVPDCPRTSLQQSMWRKLSKISRSQVAAGDLVYWPGHIGIAATNLVMIHAPRPGKTVTQATINTSGPRPGGPTLCLRYMGRTIAPSSGPSRAVLN